MSNSTPRLHYLDSLRGVAALAVVVYHYIGWHWSDKISFWLQSLVFNGSDAVSLFFVLSGFVLSWRYFNGVEKIEELDYKNYALRRFFRLYPPYFIIVIVNFLYWQRHESLGQILSNMAHNFQNLWQELLMVYPDHLFYNPGWTLGVEMGISLFLPFFVVILSYNKKLFWPLAICIYCMGQYMSQFALHFLWGVLLASKYQEITTYNFRESKYWRWRYAIGAGIFILFSIRHLLRFVNISSDDINIPGFIHYDFFLVTGIASYFIIWSVINSKKVQNVLLKEPLVFLGKISYSMYLCHWALVVLIMDKWKRIEEMFPTHFSAYITMLVFYIIMTIAFSTVFYDIVEKPFIDLGRRLTASKTNKSNN